MKSSANRFRIMALVIWGILLSAFTIVLGALPLRVLRQAVGGGAFWTAGVVLSSVSFATGGYYFSIVLFATTILIGAYTEFEERDMSIKEAGGFSVLLTTLFLSSAAYTWAAVTGKGWLTVLIAKLNEVIEQSKSLSGQAPIIEIKATDIIAQLPSIVIIMVILALGIALIFQNRVSRWSGIRMPSRERLSDFSAPDAVVWLFIFSLLGAFGEFGNKAIEIISINTLNVTVVIYFFQGLAVLSKFFVTYRVGAFWRLVWIFILAVQLPILLSLIGVVDFWADFRKALSKRSSELKKRHIED